MFRRNIFFTLSTEFITLAGNFLVGILLARGLSVADRGIMVLVMSLPWTIAGLANLGLPQANIYMIGRQKHAPRAVLGSALTLALFTGLVVAGGMYAARDLLLGTVLRGLPEEYYIPLLALIPLLLVDGALLSVLRALQRFDYYNLRRLASTMLLLAGFGSILLLARAGLAGVAAVYVGATVLLVGLSLALTRRITPISLSFSQHITRPSVRFGLKSYLQNLAGALNYRLDVYLLAFFLAPEHLAYYAIATAVAEVAWHIPDTVGVVLFPRLSNTPLEEIHAVTARVCRSTLFITALVAAGVASVSWLLIPLFYGVAYSISVVPLLILLPGVIAMGAYKVITRNYSSRDRQEVSILAGGTALMVNILLNLILIPLWGVNGAAMASTLAYTTAGGLLLRFFLRDAGLSWQEVLLPRSGELLGHVRWAINAFQQSLARVKA